MEKKYTKGKWEVNGIDEDGLPLIKKNPELDNQSYFTICVYGQYEPLGFYYPSSRQSEEQMRANAVLISCAPALLEALEALVKANPMHEGYHEKLLHALSVIKKAKGE